jgi:hypothetical protein
VRQAQVAEHEGLGLRAVAQFPAVASEDGLRLLRLVEEGLSRKG